MQHLLRATSGPQAGATYVLGRRTTIGRASDCDIQIIHEGVSRRHAKITLQADGSMIITDLSSDNGTFIEEQRITRHRLQPGDVLRVMRSRFTYEREEGSQIVTSPIFRRKVTSGESLRQTVDHGKSLAAIRAGMAKGLTGDRGRSLSRPQAAAPAPFGARPGAAGPGAVPEPDDEPDAVVAPTPGESFEGRRPTPMRPGIPLAEGGVRRQGSVLPPMGSAEAHDLEAHDPVVEEPEIYDPTEASRVRPTRETAPPQRGGMVTMGVPTHTPAGAVALDPGAPGIPPSTPRVASSSAASDEDWGSYGWHSEETRRSQRERPTVGVSTVPGLDPGPARAERPPIASPSGRMAPSVPGGPAVAASPSGRMAPSAPVAVEAPVEAPAPRAAGNGWVRLSRSTEAPRSMRPGSTLSGVPRLEDEAPASPAKVLSSTAEGSRRGVTAEYGTMNESPSSVEPAALGDPLASAEPAAVLDKKQTQPRIRRSGGTATRPLGSVIPTEEVPRIEDEEDDDDVYETRPRLARNTRASRVPTKVPRELSEPEGSQAPEPKGTAEFEPEEPEPTSEGDPSAAEVSLPGASSSRSIVAYEDTLRFERPARRADEASEPAEPADEVPQARKHVSTGELIDALEELLPIDDEPRSPDGLGERFGAELRARGAAGESFGSDPEEQRRRGLGYLVDILEYRELRLRSLRGAPIDTSRYDVLERRLQQHPLGIDDEAAMRRYTRLRCSIPAQLTHHEHGSASTVAVEVADISAGGARVTFGEYSIRTGAIVWLAFDLTQAEREGTLVPDADTVVFKARVVWTRAHDAQVGLIFAGAPQYGEDVVMDVDA